MRLFPRNRPKTAYISARSCEIILTQMPARDEAAFRSGRSGESQLRLLPVNPGIIVQNAAEQKHSLHRPSCLSLLLVAVSRPPLASVQGAFEETFERGMYEP